MLQLACELLGKHTQLGEELMRMLTSSNSVVMAEGSSAQTQSSSWALTPPAEIDVVNCQRCTPSYRAAPNNLPGTSTRTSAFDERRCLNTQWVSQPVGSEEFYSFKHMRKNHFEEVLFQCEDELFEINMIIDSSASAIRTLESLTQELNTNRQYPQEFWSMDPATLSIMDLRALERIYGDNAAELVACLRKHPEAVLPVLLRRLRQKNIEWCLARRDTNRRSKLLLQHNFHRALDHRSFYFKQLEKRLLTARNFFSEMDSLTGRRVQEKSTMTSEARGRTMHEHARTPKDATVPFEETFATTALLGFHEVRAHIGPKNDRHVVLRLQRSTLHQVLQNVLAYAAEHSNLSNDDKKRVSEVWDSLLSPFFNSTDERRDSSGDAEKSRVNRGNPREIGQAMTIYGVGINHSNIQSPGDVSSIIIALHSFTHQHSTFR